MATFQYVASNFSNKFNVADDTKLIDSVRVKTASISDDQFRLLDSPDFRTKIGVAHVRSEGRGFIKCEVTVDARIEEIAAFCFDFMSRKKVIENDRKDVLFREATEINEHAFDYVLLEELGYRLSPRLFIGRTLWKKIRSKIGGNSSVRYYALEGGKK